MSHAIDDRYGEAEEIRRELRECSDHRATVQTVENDGFKRHLATKELPLPA